MRKKEIYVSIISIVVAIAILAWIFLKPISKEVIKSEIKRFYELATPGAIAEVASLEEESGIYKAIIKITLGNQVSYREAFVTKDGEILTEGVIYMKKSSEQIAKMKAFVDCLATKGVVIYGILNQTASPEGAQATLLQLNLLGRYSPKIYFSCDEPNLQVCINAGITQVPSVAIGNIIYAGVKTIDWFEQQTGCKFR
jgi:hypothetical protein